MPFVVILWKPDVPRLRLPLGDVTSFAVDTGGRYEIRSSTLMPRVYREVRKGEWELVAADPWYLWPLAAPLPAFAWLVMGMVLVSGAIRRPQAGREPPAE